MLSFGIEWSTSYFQYSEAKMRTVFIDFGAGAGKTNLIALELGFPISVAFEVDEELLTVAEANFERHKQLNKTVGVGKTFLGDVTSLDDVRRLPAFVESLVPNNNKLLVTAFNKNSDDAETLTKALGILNQVFGTYIYLYQNPVHKNFF
jgi:ribosomal protein L11 methylase PrmA